MSLDTSATAGVVTAPTTAELLAGRASDDRPSLLFEDRSWSWRELVAEGAVRADLAMSRRRSGPFHLGVLLDNVPEYVFWIAGAAFSGATVVGINPTRRGAELAADVRHTDCSLIVTDRAHLDLLEGEDVGVGPDRVLVVDDPAYEDELAAHASAGVPGELPPGDTRLLLLFTSGSTGAPKAVVCSQGRLGRISQVTPTLFGVTRDDVCYQAMPLFHGNALMANWAVVLGTGATMALARRFTASGFLADVRRFGATYFNYVGRAVAYVLATPERPDDADNSLRLGFGTEASAPDMAEFSRRFACRLVEGYGSSEGAISMNRPPGTPPQALGRPSPAPGIDVAVVDPVSGEECERARHDADGRLLNASTAIGEIVNRGGRGAFEGYYRNDEATRERLRDGWYWSGDLGYRDEDGWFYFAGRSSDRLRVDSENFAAAPVERILARFPGAVMVAVYPVPDPRTGDQVMAAIEMAPGVGLDPGELDEFLAGAADLGTKWSPRFVRVVDRMPLTGTNTVRKQPLRQDRWRTGDPVLWRPEPGDPLRPMAAGDVEAWERELARHGRAALLDGP